MQVRKKICRPIAKILSRTEHARVFKETHDPKCPLNKEKRADRFFKNSPCVKVIHKSGG